MKDSITTLRAKIKSKEKVLRSHRDINVIIAVAVVALIALLVALAKSNINI